MIPLNPWEHQNVIKTLYGKCVEEICDSYQITRIELDILLFLANNPRFDTATDIIEIRYLSKSHVSASVKLLEQQGYIRKEYRGHNKKTAHLTICGPALEIIRAGRAAQERFLAILLEGFSADEIAMMKKFNSRILDNIHACLYEHKENQPPCNHSEASVN